MKKLLYFSLSMIVISVGLRSMEQPAKRARVESPMVQLVSSDGSVFELPKDAAELSPALQTLLSFEHSDQEMPRLEFERIDGETFSTVVKILTALHEKISHQEAGRLPKKGMIKYSLGRGDQKYEGYITRNLQELVAPFMRGVNAANVMLAFDFLAMPALANAACQWFVFGFLEKNPTKTLPEFVARVQALGIPESLLDYAKKYFRLKNYGFINELTIADCIALEGMPRVTMIDGLRTIDLSERGLTSLEGIELLPLDQLKSFNLADNRLTEWDPAKFNMVRNLEDLCLSANSITHLEPETFRDFTDLRKLDLSYNGFSVFPMGLLQPLVMLEKLSLSGNQFAVVDAGIFQELTHLRELNISKNDLRGLPSTLFRGLTALQSIDLSSNEFFRLPQEIFHDLPNLQRIAIEDNLFPGTAEEFRQLHGLNNAVIIEWGSQEGTESRMVEELQEEMQRQEESQERSRQ